MTVGGTDGNELRLMAAHRTGTVRFRHGKWYARVTLSPKDRPCVELKTCAPNEEAKARERAALLARLGYRLRDAGLLSVAPQLLSRAATRDGQALDAVVEAVERICDGRAEPPKSAHVTFREFGEMWTSGELHRRWPDHVKLKKSVDDDRERLQKYVYPIIGHVPLVELTVAHADAVLAALPSGLSPTTRRHVAQVMQKTLKYAAYPARHIERNPLPSGFLPRIAQRQALTYLYPDEDAKLLACPKVPLAHRLFYGFLAREGMRRSEAGELTWAELDLSRGAVSLDENKTDDPRAWALDAGVTRALRAWKSLRGEPDPSELVFVDEHGAPVNRSGHLCLVLRRHLRMAGLTRGELFEKSKARHPIRVHDLRATFITVSLAIGRTETWVADRSGHTSSVMINRYRRAARKVAELGLGELAPLDQAVPELRSEDAATSAVEGADAEASGAPAAAASARSRMLGMLSASVAEALAAGDVAGARVAHQALAQLLGGEQSVG